MVTVQEAEKIIHSHLKEYGTEILPFEETLGRVLSEDITADRDLPPYNRVTMDGIAIRYAAFESGTRSFSIKGIQAAGDSPIEIGDGSECIEIMTGAALPVTTDTIIRYEDLVIENGKASFTGETVVKSQHIHVKGKDKKQNDILVEGNQFITPSILSLAASVGKTHLNVKKLPRVIIISTGDELVEVKEKPSEFQVRRSNVYTIKAALEQYHLYADMLHLPDNPVITRDEIARCLQTYDVLILSGGISMGKFDYIPAVLEDLKVRKLFHKVKQRPGKPFWFGIHADKTVIFAFPGNPVSTFMCLHRYFFPWLKNSLGVSFKIKHAILDQDFHFNPPLQYFLQVNVTTNNKGQIIATPFEGNGSGDFVNLMNTNAFMELPLEQNNFKKGEVFGVWDFG